MYSVVIELNFASSCTLFIIRYLHIINIFIIYKYNIKLCCNIFEIKLITYIYFSYIHVWEFFYEGYAGEDFFLSGHGLQKVGNLTFCRSY